MLAGKIPYPKKIKIFLYGCEKKNTRTTIDIKGFSELCRRFKKVIINCFYRYAEGFSDFSIENLSINKDNLSLNLTVRMPEITASADYTAKGSFLSFKLPGKGSFETKVGELLQAAL